MNSDSPQDPEVIRKKNEQEELERIKAELNKIFSKSPKELMPVERAFLRARRSYLKDSQVEEYKEILEMDEIVDVEGNVIKPDSKTVKSTKNKK